MKPTLLMAKTWVAFLLAILLPSAALALMPDHQCAFCHDLHGAAANPLLGESNAELVCDSCHAPGATGNNVSSLKATVHTGLSFPSNRITCLGCHDPHDYQINKNNTYNLDLVLGKVNVNSTVYNVVFVDNNPSDGSADYTKPDGSGTCQVCHTLTAFQTNDGFRSGHNSPKTCTTSCHPHTRGFDR